jgi:hypothetical protein
MTLLWLITGASLVAALVAWSLARRTARRLEQLTQMYWELKFQHGELRVQLRQSNAAEALRQTGLTGEPAAPPPAAGPGQPADSFVPLTSLKR